MKMCDKYKAREIFKTLTFIIVFSYALLMLYFCIRTDALSYDEIWFKGLVKSLDEISFSDVIMMPNTLGYGSIYWTILTLCQNILFMRIAAWVCMLVMPICIILVLRKVFNRRWENVCLAILVLISCPMTWFTGKIIGPELFGNAFGVLGCTLVLLLIRKDKKIVAFTLAGALIGISFGIKLYNVVFGIYAGVYIVLNCCKYREKYSVRKQVGCLCSIIVGGGIGLLASSPIMLFDTQTYLANIDSSRTAFTWSHFYDLFFLRRIEWDLVNSGGFCYCIMSLTGIIMFGIVGLKSESTRTLTISALVSSAVLFSVFSLNSRVLGWYFLPLLFMIVLCIPSLRVCWAMAAINLCLIYSSTFYQIERKFD